MAGHNSTADHSKINQTLFQVGFSPVEHKQQKCQRNLREQRETLYLIDSKVVYMWYFQPSGEGKRQWNEAWGSPASVQVMEAIQLSVIIEIDRWGTVIPSRGVVSRQGRRPPGPIWPCH